MVNSYTKKENVICENSGVIINGITDKKSCAKKCESNGDCIAFYFDNICRNYKYCDEEKKKNKNIYYKKIPYKNLKNESLKPKYILNVDGFPEAPSIKKCSDICSKRKKCKGFHFDINEKECALYSNSKDIIKKNFGTNKKYYKKTKENFSQVSGSAIEFVKIDNKKESCSFLEKGNNLKLVNDAKSESSCKNVCYKNNKCEAYMFKGGDCFNMEKCIVEQIPIDNAIIYKKRKLEKFKNKKNNIVFSNINMVNYGPYEENIEHFAKGAAKGAAKAAAKRAAKKAAKAAAKAGAAAASAAKRGAKRLGAAAKRGARKVSKGASKFAKKVSKGARKALKAAPGAAKKGAKRMLKAGQAVGSKTAKACKKRPKACLAGGLVLSAAGVWVVGKAGAFEEGGVFENKLLQEFTDGVTDVVEGKKNNWVDKFKKDPFGFMGNLGPMMKNAMMAVGAIIVALILLKFL